MRSYLRTYGEQGSVRPNQRLQRRTSAAPTASAGAAENVLATPGATAALGDAMIQRRAETPPIVPASGHMGASPSAQALLRLQQSYGNAFVRQFIQTRLRLGAPSAPVRRPTTAPSTIGAVMTGAEAEAAVIDKTVGSQGAASFNKTNPEMAPVSAGVKTTGESAAVSGAASPELPRAPEINESPSSTGKGASQAAAATGAEGKEIPRAPATPAQDPAFQNAKTQVRAEAKKQKRHAPPGKKRLEAEDASALETKEQEDQSSKVKNSDEMERVGKERQNEGKKFSAEKFKEDFKALVNKQDPPRNAEQVKAFSQNPPIETFPKDFSDGVAKKQGEVTDPLMQQTTKKPAPDTPKETVDVPAPVQPRAPKPVDPKLAVPKAKTDQEISLQHESDRIDDAMRDNNLSDDQLAESREPQFVETLKVKQEAKKKVAEAPGEYRKREAEILQDAEKPATKLLSTDLAGLGNIHHKIGGQVFKGQKGTETQTEKRQREIKKKIDDIYNNTVDAVTGILQGMTSQVKLDFEEGLKQQTNNFNDNVRKRVSDYYGDWRIDDAVFGPADVIVKDDGSTRPMTLKEIYGGTDQPTINPDVYEIFVDEKKKFIAAMGVVLDNIAKQVEAGLTLAQSQIQLGKTSIDIFKSTLKGDELAFAEQLESEVTMKFENLESSISDTRDDLLQTMADQYRDNVAQLEKTFNEINDELKKSLIDRVIEFVETIGKTIFQLGELLLTILTRMAHLVWDIIKHPIRFFETLVSGLKQGIGRFIDNIGDYLQEAFWTWITGATSVTSIRLSASSGIEGLFDLVLQVLRFGPADIRAVVERVFGKKFMELVDKGLASGEKLLEPVIILLTKGPVALWDRLKDTLGAVIKSSFDRIKESVFYGFIEKGLKWIAGFFIPGGGFVKIVKAIFSAFQFVVENLDNIRHFFEAVFDSMESATEGHTEGVASKIITGLKTGVVLALDFLAKQLGLSKIIDGVQNIIKSLRRPIVSAIEFVLGKVKPFVTKIMMKGKKLLDKGVDKFVAHERRLREGIKQGARGAARRVLNLLGLRKNFKANNESHSLYFVGTARKPSLVVATTPEHIGKWINRRKSELEGLQLYDAGKQAAVAAITRDLRTLGNLTYSQSPTPPTNPEQAIEGILNRIVKNINIIGFSNNIVPVPRMVVIPGFSSQKAADTTVVQFLYKDPANHRPGTPTTGRESLLGAWEKLTQLGISRRFWKSGHMLNKDFGGLADNSNLIPIPQTVNRAMEAEFDNKVSRELYRKKKVIWMRFTIERNHPQDIEKHFASNFKAEAAEMPLSNNTYTIPPSGKINFERGGADLPYPAIPSSDLTLNTIIMAQDSSRESVRKVVRNTQLEERLVRDLVARGIKLDSVDDIRIFINSKLGDYGAQRVSNYLANFERRKNTIVL